MSSLNKFSKLRNARAIGLGIALAVFAMIPQAIARAKRSGADHAGSSH